GRACAPRLALRPCAARGDPLLRLGRVPVHAVRLELEHERRDPGGVPRLRALARHVALGAGSLFGPVRLDEVRVADRGPALARLPAVARTVAREAHVPPGVRAHYDRLVL